MAALLACLNTNALGWFNMPMKSIPTSQHSEMACSIPSRMQWWGTPDSRSSWICPTSSPQVTASQLAPEPGPKGLVCVGGSKGCSWANFG